MNDPATARPTVDKQRIRQLRDLAFRSLEAMYLPDAKAYVHSLRLTNGELVKCGVSGRYTSITLLGLVNEATSDVSRVLH
jgi:hypothetical protein